MSDFEAEISQLETAASNARDASGDIADVDLPAAVDGIATAMPGSSSAVSAPELGTSWTGEKDALTEGLDNYAAGLEAAARTYRDTDEAAAQDFG
ncbi:hypothetical protein ACPYO6_04480 [Georgenia sp. Z1344]|uniref:hypothetical protein n=1 Tax=Georgenia sp. Z1344 TaxID=3416706 RepID=UPI003CF7C06E